MDKTIKHLGNIACSVFDIIKTCRQEKLLHILQEYFYFCLLSFLTFHVTSLIIN